MGEYHQISGMIIEKAGLTDLFPRLDEGQRRSLKALSSLRAAIKPPLSLWAALLHGFSTAEIQSTLARIRRSIKLAERAVKRKDSVALGTQAEYIRDELSGLRKFFRMMEPLSAHPAIPEYAEAILSGLRSLQSLAA